MYMHLLVCAHIGHAYSTFSAADAVSGINSDTRHADFFPVCGERHWLDAVLSSHGLADREGWLQFFRWHNGKADSPPVPDIASSVGPLSHTCLLGIAGVQSAGQGRCEREDDESGCFQEQHLAHCGRRRGQGSCASPAQRVFLAANTAHATRNVKSPSGTGSAPSGGHSL